MNQQTQIRADYVNARDGRKPPSIKGSDNNYYTLSDAAYQMLAPIQGQTGSLTFWVNEKGFNIATHWNGQELPKDQRGGAPQQAAQALPPMAAPSGVVVPQVPAPAPPIPTQSLTVTPPPPPPTSTTWTTPPSDSKGADIFLTGVVQQAMSTGKFGITDIKALALAARDAWAAAHGQETGAMPDGRPEAPLADEIGF